MSIAEPQAVEDSLQFINNQNFFRELLELRGDVIDITTVVSADTDFSVTHGVGRIPTNVEVLVKEGQTSAYILVRPGSVAWTTTTINLQCNTNTATFRIRIT